MTDNKEIKVLEKEIVPYFKRAEKVIIKNAVHMADATMNLSVLNKYNDQVKERKESVTKPLTLALKNARALFSPLEDRLEVAIKSVRDAMISYQTEQKAIADAEAKKIEARIGEGKGRLRFDTAVAKIDAIDKPESSVSTDVGSIQFVTVKCFEVTDISKVPVKFLLPNEVLIRNAMKLGEKLPGIRYFEEQRPRNSR